ncbi:helix-turn-helix domain-containing protein [Qipengyuania sp. 1NDH17]|uniref:Helix-turn-helix domain-containing protein n=1 Tax=Qipengyuania polymorpha TaxID=2867234 RepID=A0ABS7J2R2_9SPHN|nr:helix-turn-helix domain-containing protein [Qipengyuania polymorpha]MBX7458865.1 helix-turn-helix domain-containing protein [Qipengyuania polymorpha]
MMSLNRRPPPKPHRANGRSAALASSTGLTRDGLPLAYSRAPARDIAPWVQSLAVVDIEDGTGRRRCGFFSDNPVIRVPLRGQWRFQTADGPRDFDARHGSRTLYFGPQTREMEVEVRGPIRFLMVQFHPGAPSFDQSKTHEETLDRIECFDSDIPGDIRRADYDVNESRETWLDQFEERCRQVLFQRVKTPPEEMSLAISQRLLTDVDFDLDEVAEQFGVSRRTVERHVRTSFGISPKQAVRRARALDMAAALLGVAMPEEEADFRLRYFDQSHMTREIQHFFGTSPGALARMEAVLLRIDLEIRQMRRLEAMDELGVAQVPWRDPEAEPPTNGAA